MRRLVFGIVCLLTGIGETLGQAQNEAHLPEISKRKANRYVIFPVIVKSPEYKWGGGLAGTYYFSLTGDSLTRTSSFKAVSFYTVRKQLVFASEGNVFFPKEKYILHTIASISHFPDKFWGLGNTTPSSNLENYVISQVDLYPQLMRKVYNSFFVGLGYEYQNVFDFDYTAGGLFDQENIIGKNGGHISGVSFILSWDNRNNAFSPSKGFYAQYLIATYQNFLGSQFNFYIQNWDLRKYFAITKRSVLAMQFNMIITNGSVPIRNMSNIGSNSYMRGYYEGRYTDEDLIAFQMEYRTPLWKRLGAVIFAGTGKVSEQFFGLWDFSHIKPSVGIGLRFAVSSKEKLNLRVDAGFGQGAQGSYINMGEAF